MTTEYERTTDYQAPIDEEAQPDDQASPDDRPATGYEAAPGYDAAPRYDAAPGYDAAIEEARKAGDGGTIDGFVERMAERVGGKASVRAVFGDAIEREGLTIIPVAKVRWGFGGGAGSGPIAMGPGRPGETSPFSGATDEDATGARSGFGTGGGGGATAEPVGYLQIGPDGAEFIPITEARPSPAFLLAAGATAALVLRGLARLIRR